MSDVAINYKGNTIATMDASGTKTLLTSGKYCEDDLEVVYTKPGGSSAWTKIAETTYTVNTSSTQAGTVATWATRHPEIWTSGKIVYVRIRDTAGKRAGRFYGTDTFFMNMYPENESGTSGSNGILTNIWRYTSDGAFAWRYGYATTGYGVYPDTIYSDGRIRIRRRYNSSYSLTINATYKVEVYLLDPADGVLPFA